MNKQTNECEPSTSGPAKTTPLATEENGVGNHMFSLLVRSGMAGARAIAEERGSQYGDSWQENPWVFRRALLKHFQGRKMPSEHTALTADALAMMCDVKFSRLQSGGYKLDHLEDMLNYLAALIGQLKAISAAEEICLNDEEKDGGSDE